MFCALMIVIIHTKPLLNHSAVLHFYLTDVLSRTAVPLFFGMSGFLLFGRMRWENGKLADCSENRARLKKYLGNLVWLYAGWSAVYLVIRLPEWYQAGWWGIPLVKDIAVAFFTRGLYYHLWYLLASIYACGLGYLLLSRCRIKGSILIAGILWILECMVYSYPWVAGERLHAVLSLADRFPTVFDTVLRALPLMLLGGVCARDSDRSRIRRRSVQAVIWGMALVLEASMLWFFSPNREKFSYLFSTPFLMYSLLWLLAYGPQCRMHPKTAAILRKSSLVIYCIHPLIISILNSIRISDRPTKWLLTTILSGSIALLWSAHSYKKKVSS